jgi:hypothetical protein
VSNGNSTKPIDLVEYCSEHLRFPTSSSTSRIGEGDAESIHSFVNDSLLGMVYDPSLIGCQGQYQTLVMLVDNERYSNHVWKRHSTLSEGKLAYKNMQ